MTTRTVLVGVCLVVSSACGTAAPGSSILGTGVGGSAAASAGGSTAGTSTPGVGGSSAGSGPIINIGGDLNGGTGGLPGNGLPETCDGLDNDANGIIDDVDVGMDGVCDCLTIATIGQIGPWSNGGNIFVSWLNARSPQGAVALDDQVLTPELLAPFQIIVSLYVGPLAVSNGDVMSAAYHAFSPEESAAFKGWIESGGGVMTTIGYSNDEAAEATNVNLLLGQFGLGYSTTNLQLEGDIGTWEPHPVTMGVSNIATHNGVEPEGSGMNLAFGNGNRVALQVGQVVSGRAVVWGDEWITYDSEWQDIQDQQVELFWLNILKWLSPPNECQVAIPPTVQ